MKSKIRWASAEHKAKDTELSKQWDNIVKSHSTKKKPLVSKKRELTFNPMKNNPAYQDRNTLAIASKDDSQSHATKKDDLKYTGGNIKGIGTMHKSSMVPIFSEQEAIDIATMRRN